MRFVPFHYALDLIVRERTQVEAVRELVIAARVAARFSRELEPALARQGLIGVERALDVSLQVRGDAVVVSPEVMFSFSPIIFDSITCHFRMAFRLIPPKKRS